MTTCTACGRSLDEARALDASVDGEDSRFYCDTYCLRAGESDGSDELGAKVVAARRLLTDLEAAGISRSTV